MNLRLRIETADPDFWAALAHIKALAELRYSFAWWRNELGSEYIRELHRQEPQNYPQPPTPEEMMDNVQIASAISARLRRELEDFKGRRADDPATLRDIEAEIAQAMDSLGLGLGWLVRAEFHEEDGRIQAEIFYEEDEEPREPRFDFYLATDTTPEHLPGTTLVEHVAPADAVDANLQVEDKTLPGRARALFNQLFVAPDGLSWRVRRIKNEVLELACVSDPERAPIQYKVDYFPPVDWRQSSPLSPADRELAELARLVDAGQHLHGFNLATGAPLPIDVTTEEGLDRLFLRLEDIEGHLAAIRETATRLEAYRELVKEQATTPAGSKFQAGHVIENSAGVRFVVLAALEDEYILETQFVKSLDRGGRLYVDANYELAADE